MRPRHKVYEGNFATLINIPMTTNTRCTKQNGAKANWIKKSQSDTTERNIMVIDTISSRNCTHCASSMFLDPPRRPLRTTFGRSDSTYKNKSCQTTTSHCREKCQHLWKCSILESSATFRSGIFLNQYQSKHYSIIDSSKLKIRHPKLKTPYENSTIKVQDIERCHKMSRCNKNSERKKSCY
jgi:hypothetical protein